MTGGHLNGSGKVPGDGKIASLDEARKRAAAKAKAAKRAARGHMGARDWIIGGVIIAMALGMLWQWLWPLVRATGVTR
jgi:hypothetical protein